MRSRSSSTPSPVCSGDELRLREAIAARFRSERVEPVDLVEDEHDGQLVPADVGQHGAHGRHLLAQPVVRQRRVGDVEDQVGDDRLLERRGEPCTSWVGRRRMKPTVSVTR